MFVCELRSTSLYICQLMNIIIICTFEAVGVEKRKL